MLWIGPGGPRVPGEVAEEVAQDRIARLEAKADRYRELHSDEDDGESRSWPQRTVARIHSLLARRSRTPAK